jgi:hypothetical protein
MTLNVWHAILRCAGLLVVMLSPGRASASQIGRFETEWLASSENFAALTDLCGGWIDRVHHQRPPKAIVLDMDSSVSSTYGEQEGSAYNGHFGCTCYHPRCWPV